MAGGRGIVFGASASGGGGGGGARARVFSSDTLLQAFSLSTSSSFLGSSSMVSFDDVCGGGKRPERPFFCTYDGEENGDDDYDEYLNQPEKKRRLSIEQVQFLEQSFETDNKLEPDRKIQLAKELGLQPRQVAIWFQNRRARWKTKQMEKDFHKLQANFNCLKSDYEILLKEKEKLKAEVVHLTHQVEQKEQRNSEPFNISDQLNTNQQNPNAESASESEEQHLLIFGYTKQEDPSSAKSDVISSDSPHYGSSFAEQPCDQSSYPFEADHSDISQDDEDYLNNTLLPSSHDFPKIEDVNPPANSSHFVLSGDDHASLFWPYWDINLKIPTSLYM